MPNETEQNESYENDALAYKQLQFGDVSSQLTPPDTPQEWFPTNQKNVHIICANHRFDETPYFNPSYKHNPY